MTYEEIEQAALALCIEERIQLRDLLLASIGRLGDVQYNQLWGAEAYRRLEEYESGLVGDISAEDALREVRESLS